MFCSKISENTADIMPHRVVAKLEIIASLEFAADREHRLVASRRDQGERWVGLCATQTTAMAKDERNYSGYN